MQALHRAPDGSKRPSLLRPLERCSEMRRKSHAQLYFPCGGGTLRGVISDDPATAPRYRRMSPAYQAGLLQDKRSRALTPQALERRSAMSVLRLYPLSARISRLPGGEARQGTPPRLNRSEARRCPSPSGLAERAIRALAMKGILDRAGTRGPREVRIARRVPRVLVEMSLQADSGMGVRSWMMWM